MSMPTKYKPEYGVKILEKMAEGFSLAAAASFIDVHRQRVYDWMEAHDDFRALVELGKVKRQSFLEERLMRMEATGPQTTANIFALKNASADWREDLQSKVTVDQTINHNHTLKIDQLSAEQLESLALMLAPKASDDSLLIDGQVVEDDG